MNPTDQNSRQPRPSLGWSYTPGEERMMEKARALAAKYMEGYGKGRAPMMIDKSKYLQ